MKKLQLAHPCFRVTLKEHRQSFNALRVISSKLRGVLRRQLAAGGKPSTWLPPGRLVEHFQGVGLEMAVAKW